LDSIKNLNYFMFDENLINYNSSTILFFLFGQLIFDNDDIRSFYVEPFIIKILLIKLINHSRLYLIKGLEFTLM
jgi:hypothetical protein